jgi:hypothetical protein
MERVAHPQHSEFVARSKQKDFVFSGMLSLELQLRYESRHAPPGHRLPRAGGAKAFVDAFS